MKSDSDWSRELELIKVKKLKELKARYAPNLEPQSTRIAIPSTPPGGLDASCSLHFGHSPFFTLVDVVNGAIRSVAALKNVPHTFGGCSGPVELLLAYGVNVLLVGGIGMRPLLELYDRGIDVYAGISEGSTVRDAVNAFLNGKLRRVREEDTCKRSWTDLGGCYNP